MRTAIATYELKIESLMDIIIHRVYKLIYGKSIANSIKWRKQYQQLKKKYFINGIWDFKGVKLPNYDIDNPELLYQIYLDTLFVYCVHNDNYNYLLIDELDKILPEGTYGYKKNDFDVTVNENDIVIDAGAWIGDFSAYASIKGATVFSFEPSSRTIALLKKTQELNSNIQIVEKGLGDKSGIYNLSHNNINSGANRIDDSTDNSEKIEVTTIDDFIIERGITRVDFIKADIEGYERNMLIGAKETLKRFGPKLAICTYHLPDDPEVLSTIILDANPNYTIIQKKNKLFAMVKKWNS